MPEETEVPEAAEDAGSDTPVRVAPPPLPLSADEQGVAPISVKPIRAAIKEFSVRLPCGIVHKDKVLRHMTLRTISVVDRRVFGQPKYRDNPTKAITDLLVQKIVSVTDLGTVTANTVRAMLSHDRDYLIYMLRKETVNDRPFVEKFVCSNCRGKNEAEFSSDEIEESFVEMSDESRLTTQDGRCVFYVDLPEYGFKATYVHPNGHFQEYLSSKVDDEVNPFELDDEIMARLCVDWNGDGKIRPDDVSNLDFEFKDDLEAAIREHRYGFDMNPETRCYRCKEKQRVRMEPLDFLFNTTRRRQKTQT